MWRSILSKKARITTPFKKAGAWACGYHTGVDVVPFDGSTSPTLYAPAGGKVVKNSYDANGYGYYIIVKTNAHVYLMGHMKTKSPLKVGATVHMGDKVGVMGNTGNSYGRHCHLEVEDGSAWRYAKKLVNPVKIIDFKKYAKTK